MIRRDPSTTRGPSHSRTDCGYRAHCIGVLVKAQSHLPTDNEHLQDGHGLYRAAWDVCGGEILNPPNVLSRVLGAEERMVQSERAFLEAQERHRGLQAELARSRCAVQVCVCVL